MGSEMPVSMPVVTLLPVRAPKLAFSGERYETCKQSSCRHGDTLSHGVRGE